MTIDLPDEVLAELQAKAARRGISVEDLIAESATELVAVHAPPALPRKIEFDPVGERLSLSGVGASGGRHGWARDADEALAKGFGRD